MDPLPALQLWPLAGNVWSNSGSLPGDSNAFAGVSSSSGGPLSSTSVASAGGWSEGDAASAVAAAAAAGGGGNQGFRLASVPSSSMSWQGSAPFGWDTTEAAATSYNNNNNHDQYDDGGGAGGDLGDMMATSVAEVVVGGDDDHYYGGDFDDDEDYGKNSNKNNNSNNAISKSSEGDEDNLGGGGTGSAGTGTAGAGAGAGGRGSNVGVRGAGNNLRRGVSAPRMSPASGGYSSNASSASSSSRGGATAAGGRGGISNSSSSSNNATTYAGGNNMHTTRGGYARGGAVAGGSAASSGTAAAGGYGRGGAGSAAAANVKAGNNRYQQQQQGHDDSDDRETEEEEQQAADLVHSVVTRENHQKVHLMSLLSLVPESASKFIARYGAKEFVLRHQDIFDLVEREQGQFDVVALLGAPSDVARQNAAAARKAGKTSGSSKASNNTSNNNVAAGSDGASGMVGIGGNVPSADEIFRAAKAIHDDIILRGGTVFTCAVFQSSTIPDFVKPIARYCGGVETLLRRFPGLFQLYWPSPNAGRVHALIDGVPAVVGGKAANSNKYSRNNTAESTTAPASASAASAAANTTSTAPRRELSFDDAADALYSELLTLPGRRCEASKLASIGSIPEQLKHIVRRIGARVFVRRYQHLFTIIEKESGQFDIMALDDAAAGAGGGSKSNNNNNKAGPRALPIVVDKNGGEGDLGGEDNDGDNLNDGGMGSYNDMSRVVGAAPFVGAGGGGQGGVLQSKEAEEAAENAYNILLVYTPTYRLGALQLFAHYSMPAESRNLIKSVGPRSFAEAFSQYFVLRDSPNGILEVIAVNGAEKAASNRIVPASISINGVPSVEELDFAAREIQAEIIRRGGRVPFNSIFPSKSLSVDVESITARSGGVQALVERYPGVFELERIYPNKSILRIRALITSITKFRQAAGGGGGGGNTSSSSSSTAAAAGASSSSSAISSVLASVRRGDLVRAASDFHRALLRIGGKCEGSRALSIGGIPNQSRQILKKAGVRVLCQTCPNLFSLEERANEKGIFDVIAISSVVPSPQQNNSSNNANNYLSGSTSSTSQNRGIAAAVPPPPSVPVRKSGEIIVGGVSVSGGSATTTYGKKNPMSAGVGPTSVAGGWLSSESIKDLIANWESAVLHIAPQLSGAPLAADDLSSVRRWSERLVVQVLERILGQGGDVRWVNRDGERSDPYDVACTIGGKLVFLKVKATVAAEKDSFEVSVAELDFARTKRHYFWLVRVFEAGSANARTVLMINPSTMLGTDLQILLRVRA